jgi:hypothetical protein
VGWTGIEAETVSAKRRRILFEPESAHASVGSGLGLEAVGGKVDCGAVKVKHATLAEDAGVSTDLRPRPSRQAFVLPPGGDDAVFAAR